MEPDLDTLATRQVGPLRTPLVDHDGNLVKVESRQRSGSVKYRLVHRRIIEALGRGELDGEPTLIEASSGSTGVALAYYGAQMRYPVEIHVYDGIDSSLISRMHAFGAKVVVHEKEEPFDDILNLIDKKVRFGSAWHLRQFDKDLHERAYRSLTRELLEQLGEDGLNSLERLVCPVGSGGILQAVGKVLRVRRPEIQVVAVEPAKGFHINGCRNADTVDLGDDDPYDRSFPDIRIFVDRIGPPVTVGDASLGPSSRACIDVVRQSGWRNSLIIAPS